MLFNLNLKTTLGVLALVALLALGLAIPKCHGADLGPTDAPYVQLSGGKTWIRGPAPVLDLTFTQPASVLRNAYWQESLTVIGSSTWHNESVPNNFIVRALFVDGFGRFDVGLGISWMQVYLPYNGSSVNFALQLDYRFKRLPVTLTVAHESNAGTRLPNLGRDEIMLGWRFH